MKTPLIFLISLTTLCTATGVEAMETHHLYGAIGSSVLFPVVDVDNDTFYDLIRADESVVVTCYGVCQVRFPYTERGHFYQNNGTFLLNELRAEDNGTFVYKINLIPKGRIHLLVMAAVKEPVLLKQEAIVNGSQCLVTFTCQAEGDGPFNFTLLRDDNEIIQSVIGPDNSSSVIMDGWHPKTFGRFSCMVANAISSQTSPAIERLPPVPLKGMVMELIVIAFLCHWIFALCILCVKYICMKLRKEKNNNNEEKNHNNEEKNHNNEEKNHNNEEKNHNNEEKTLQSDAHHHHHHHGPEHRDTASRADGSLSIRPLSRWGCPNHTHSTVNEDKILGLINRTFTIADNILGFLKEFAVLIICLDEAIMPAGWWCAVAAVPGSFLLCRVIYWIFFFMNRHRETNVRFSSTVGVFCSPAMIASNMIVIPAFCIAILVILLIRYRPPCGTMDISPLILTAVCVLIFIFYLWIKSKVKAKGKEYIQGKEDQPESQQLVNVPNGDIGRPKNNGDIGAPENNGDIGRPKNNGDLGGPKNNGDIGRPKNNGDLGGPKNNGDIGGPEDNRNPNCEGPVLPGIVGNPNVDQEAPMQSEVFNEGDPEDQMIPKPKDGQLAEEVPCNSHVGAGHCLLTIEKELVVDKGPVSNG
ncbi:uncharacterized protein LOC120924009 [Rana temporaria]|uniref:uncharacterized protein LOC120924009 n=1 Tax=Rana temporaria TaxID=8407 RepID=UPI001AACBDF3|nr:uncharacterized protein LOC120924009 [Rana temporaria]